LHLLPRGKPASLRLGFRHKHLHSVRGQYAPMVCLRKSWGGGEAKKQELSRKSGPSWGALVHGNRILASAVFRRLDAAKLSQPISAFAAAFKPSDIDAICEAAYGKIVAAIQMHYAGKFLAVLFKNPTMSKHVFDLAIT
ncbi:MAG: hypothetical protein OEV04_14540, partial [Nitrospira sp.]|nr:hypothetical protein [Nitrospira sp.]